MNDPFLLRVAAPGDLPGITHVRTSVRENHLSVEGMVARGITLDGIARDMSSGELAAWVVEEEGAIVAFSMADRRDGQIFALFTLPGHEGRGYGKQLLSAALDWLEAQGRTAAWLSTDPGTRAERFYLGRGWRPDGFRPNGEVLFRIDLAGGN